MAKGGDMRRRANGVLVFGEGDKEWTAPDPAERNRDFQATAYRVLCLSHDGLAKLREIRRGLKKVRP